MAMDRVGRRVQSGSREDTRASIQLDHVKESGDNVNSLRFHFAQANTCEFEIGLK
jgi:hypothetical protein